MKKLPIFVIIVLVIVGAYLLISKSERSNIEPQSGMSIEFQTIFKGENSGGEFVTKADIVIDDQTKWQQVWGTLSKNQDPQTVPPAVDFDKESVIVSFQGQKGSGGYEIEIKDVKRSDDTVSISILETEPGKSCSTTSVITEPFHIIKLPISNLSEFKVDFKRNTKINECE